MELHFKAAVLENLGKPLVIKRLKVPNLDFGQVMVKVKFSGVCRSQLMETHGLRSEDKFLPHLLGHEGVGTVIKVGEGVRKVKVGDEVIIGWIKGIGISSSYPIFTEESGMKISAGAATTFSEITIVSENRIYLKPTFLEDKVALLFGCAFLTGAGMVFNELTPKKSESVLILGLGGVGLSTLVSLLTINPKMIIVGDISSDRRRLVQELGVENVLDPSDRNFIAQVCELSKGGVDVAYECAGTAESIETAFECVKLGGGQLIFASHPTSGDKIHLDPHALIQGKIIRGSWGGGSRPDSDIPKFAELVRNHSVNLHLLLGKSYKLDEINLALNDLQIGKTIRPIIDMKH